MYMQMLIDIGLLYFVEKIVYFSGFCVKHVCKEIEKFIGHKNIQTNIFRIQSKNSIMCGYISIGFIDFMFVDNILVHFTGLFFLYDFEKNGNIILSYFKDY